MAQPNYFSIIPATVRYDKSLKASEKLLYSELTALANKEGFCFASNSYFAGIYGVKAKAISIWINNLKKADYIRIEIDKKNGNARRIYINDLSSKKGIPIPQKREYNNTSINNKNNNIYCSEQNALSLDDEVVFLLPLNDKKEYKILKSDIDYWKELYPLADIDQELKNMKGWLDSNVRKRKTKNGIRKFINSWLARTQDKRVPTAPPWHGQTIKTPSAIPDADETEVYLKSIERMRGG